MRFSALLWGQPLLTVPPRRRERARMKSFIALTASAVLLSCTHAPRKPKSANPTGIEAFSRFPKFAGAKISPHGAYLAAVSVENGRAALVFIDLKTRKLASVFRPLPQS